MNLIKEQVNGVRHFVVDNNLELAMLPTLNTAGQGVLCTVKKTASGSTCKVIDSGDFYILNSQNIWTKTSAGGGSGDIDPSDLATRTDIDNMFDNP